MSPGAQLARAVVQLGPLDQAEQRAGRAELLDRAVGAQDRGQRVPAAGDGRARGRAREVEVQAGDRAEAADELGRLLAQHRLAEQPQDRRRRAPAHRRGADRVARHRGHRGRLGALAADVADDRVPLVLGGVEDVVEVAADLGALARRAVDGRELEARDLGQRRRQQRRLQRARDRRARRVEPRVLDRGRGARGEALGEREVAGVERVARSRRSTNVITPTHGCRAASIGTTIAEVIPIERSSARCSSSRAAATSISSVITG